MAYLPHRCPFSVCAHVRLIAFNLSRVATHQSQCRQPTLTPPTRVPTFLRQCPEEDSNLQHSACNTVPLPIEVSGHGGASISEGDPKASTVRCQRVSSNCPSARISLSRRTADFHTKTSFQPSPTTPSSYAVNAVIAALCPRGIPFSFGVGITTQWSIQRSG